MMLKGSAGSLRVRVATVSAAAVLSVAMAPAAHGVAADGACCLSDGSCEDSLDFECETSGGTFVGFGTSCEAVACDGTMAPVLSGAALLLVASLLAITGVLALRRRFSR